MKHRRLLADRLCYLAEGTDGLRKRHGMQRAYEEDNKFWWDKYDSEALRQIREKQQKQKDVK
jgi:hypothetical protein